MSPAIGAVGLVLALAGFLSLVGLTQIPLYIVELSQFHTLPLLNAIPPAWLYMLLGILLLMLAGSGGPPARPPEQTTTSAA